MVQKSSVTKYLFFFVATVICAIYLFLRLSHFDTIEFGYDQPRLATRIIQYIDNGKLIDTQKFAEKSPWGNISWGPSLFFFYAPFFLVSRNPLLVSNMIAIFNLVSVVLVIYLGQKYFSKVAGLVAGLLLATHPWWYIFSRMIYQPTAVVSLIAISMVLFFMTLRKPNSFWLALTIFSWVFLVELYVHSISFVLISAVSLFASIKFKLINRYLIIGIVTSLLLTVPYFYNFNLQNYLLNDNENIKTQLVEGRDDYFSRIKTISIGLISVLSGNSFEYQLGYGNTDFEKDNALLTSFRLPIIFLNFLVLVYSFLAIFIRKEKKMLRATIFLWAISPLFFLVLVRLPNVPPIPRYFLISLPSFALLWGIFANDISTILKGRIFIALPILVAVFWAVFVFRYEIFIKNYNFTNGHLSTYSDTQYNFLKNSIDFIIKDSGSKGFNRFVVSSDETNPKNFALDWAAWYVVVNVYEINRDIDKNSDSTGYYLIDYSIGKNDSRFTKILRSGPYTVYQFTDR